MDIVMPQLGETVAEGTLTVWHKKPGDRVEANELLFEVSTDKVDTEIPAPASGILVEVLIKEGITVDVGTRLGVIQADGEEAMAPSSPIEEAPRPAGPAVRATVRDPSAPPPPLSPVVSRLLAEHGLNAADINGTGAGGRIKRKDVEAHKALLAAREGDRRAAASGEGTVIPFNTIRKRTADHMVRSKAISPHVLQAVEVDFHRIAKIRQRDGAAWKDREGFTLTYLPFIAYAVCQALRDFPHVNASVDGESLIVWNAVHLGIAVDLDFTGLVAPVIRSAQEKSVAGLARDIADLAVRARAKTLLPDDFAGGTYTISNSGVFGTLITAPIINQPQVAILSTDGIKKRPVVVETDDGETIVARPVGILAQSFDHRAIDGAYSAAFLNRIRDVIEQGDWEQSLS
ncbi:MAG: dihydrolipoamide acetyltransferase family protein [Proteobacteria bacterium]|nr:dihydrolipoamide acetyltransferase family protein [Pseudomonadota bacterium]